VEVPILENGATNDINGFFSVQHLTHFSRGSLENVMRAGGWRILEIQTQPDYNGCRVVAVPNSAAEIAANRDDARLLYEYLTSWYRAVADVEARISAMDAAPDLVIWGGGLHSEFLYQFTSLFRRAGKTRYAVVDSDPLKQGKTWRGIPMQPPGVLSGLDWSSARLLVSTYGSQAEVVAEAGSLGVPERAILTLYETIRRY